MILPRFSEENFQKNVELADKIKAITEKPEYKAKGATPSQVALAWILAESQNCKSQSLVGNSNGEFGLVLTHFCPPDIPIPGCRSVERVEENAAAAELELSPEDVKTIRQLVEQADVRGPRYSSLSAVEGNCIPLSEWKGEV